MKAFDRFSLFSGLRPSKSKCEVAVIEALKGISLALCGMNCIDWTNKNYKKSWVFIFLIIKNLKEENFKTHILKIEKVLKLLILWK